MFTLLKEEHTKYILNTRPASFMPVAFRPHCFLYHLVAPINLRCNEKHPRWSLGLSGRQKVRNDKDGFHSLLMLRCC